MPQYVIRLVHTSDQCPTSNSKVRERVLKGMPEMPKLAQKLGVKFLAGPLLLGSTHESLAVVEARNVETVDDMMMMVHAHPTLWEAFADAFASVRGLAIHV